MTLPLEHIQRTLVSKKRLRLRVRSATYAAGVDGWSEIDSGRAVSGDAKKL